MRRLLSVLLLILCIVMMLPVLADDDEDDGGGGNAIDANLQWRYACTAWDRREYDNAAAIYLGFARANPDNDNTLEGYWRTYEIFRAYRPNPTRKKDVWTEALGVCERWVKKYAGDDKNKAASSRWYKAMLLDREGNRAMAIAALNELVTKFPGTANDANAFWTLGEWLREAQRYNEAVGAYNGYIKTVGVTDWGAVCWYRIGMCYESLGNKEGAVEAYKAVLNENGYNWRWYYTAHGAIDVAHRLRAMGEEELARAYALKIIDGADPSWTDLKSQANQMLGEKGIIPKYVRIYPYVNETFNSYEVNITGNSKLQVSRDLPVLVRLENASKDDPFKGTVTLVPKVTLEKKADNMKASEAGDKKIFTADIAAPDANGQVTGDWWYNFSQEDQTENVPDNVAITRSWEKMENNVGLCTITIQSSARYYIYITLPNTKTNVNNVSIQPHDILDGGKTFRWYDWLDLTKGLTVKFPVELSNAVEAYYPKIRLERSLWGYQTEISGNNTTAGNESKYMAIKLIGEKAFPYTFTYNGSRVIVLNESMK